MKPENIVFQQNNIKIIDFGKSHKFNKKHHLSDYNEVPYYIAPEVIDGDYTEKCDIWSCGVIIYLMLSGQTPFNGLDDD